jgi:formamidase
MGRGEETVLMRSFRWTGGQVKNSDDADDIRDVDLSRIHYISGPIAVETAE